MAFVVDLTLKDMATLLKVETRAAHNVGWQRSIIEALMTTMELERSENVIVVTHQALLCCIYAYFPNVPQEKSLWMEIPLYTPIKFTPRAYCTEEQRFKADIPAVSTWRGKGSSAKHGDSPADKQ